MQCSQYEQPTYLISVICFLKKTCKGTLGNTSLSQDKKTRGQFLEF